MYKNYNMTQLTLPIETSVRIPQNDISRYVNEILKRYLIANSMNSDIIVAQHPIIQNDIKNHLICIYSICIFWS